MKDVSAKVLISDIFLDESIYPRENIDHKRVGIFVENLRDGFVFEPIVVQVCLDPEIVAKKGKYRILDGVHRWSTYKKTGVNQIDVVIKTLNNIEPILYAAKMAIGPRQLTEAETRNTARRAFQINSRLTSSEIGRAIGRSRQAVDKYIADLRATALFDLDLKIFRLNQLGIPQDRIAKRVGLGQQRISRYLLQMPQVAKSVNADLLKGFTVPQVAQKHGWPESLVWSQALVNKDDFSRFKALQWGIRTWDVWNFMDCDNRFGDEWPARHLPAMLRNARRAGRSRPNDAVSIPEDFRSGEAGGPGRIPAQLVAHILYFFSEPNDLVFDPMAGGGVCADTCLAMGRRCWSLDMEDRPDTRPEIEPYYWDPDKEWENLPFFNAREKPALIICDPPYFDKKAREYAKESISGLSKTDYLIFLERFFLFLKKAARKDAWLAFINADWPARHLPAMLRNARRAGRSRPNEAISHAQGFRSGEAGGRDFQNCPARKENPKQSILLVDYYEMFKKTGWTLSHIIQAPMSSERFNAGVVSAMQKKKILGVTSRWVMFLK